MKYNVGRHAHPCRFCRRRLRASGALYCTEECERAYAAVRRLRSGTAVTTEEILDGIQDQVKSGKGKSPWVDATATASSIIFTTKEGVDPNSIAIDMPQDGHNWVIIRANGLVE